MSELKTYIKRRTETDAEFAEDYDQGYENLRLGIRLQILREQAELTQAQVAQKMGTKKSAVSRIENHAQNITLSTLHKYAKALGKKVNFDLV